MIKAFKVWWNIAVVSKWYTLMGISDLGLFMYFLPVHGSCTRAVGFYTEVCICMEYWIPVIKVQHWTSFFRKRSYHRLQPPLGFEPLHQTLTLDPNKSGLSTELLHFSTSDSTPFLLLVQSGPSACLCLPLVPLVVHTSPGLPESHRFFFPRPALLPFLP